MTWTRERIESTIASDAVVLFMKGQRRAPQCGFSARVVGILDQFLPEYTTVNVLEDPDLRQGIKDFSSWPTVPQLYIRGEFVGGCDIVTELFQSGELEAKLGVSGIEVAPPKVTVTAAAAKALQNAIKGDERVRLEIDGRFNHDLTIGPRQPTDFEVESNGFVVLVSRTSAARADGLTIDFVSTSDGPAFKIDNPNEPPRVKQISVKELKSLMDSKQPFELIDVRSADEQAIARIDGARLLDAEEQKRIGGLDKGTTLVFHCHHGGRSQAAAEHFLSLGFRNVSNVSGGIEAWSREIDPSVPRY